MSLREMLVGMIYERARHMGHADCYLAGAGFTQRDIVGTYKNLAELMVLTQTGKVTLPREPTR